jgi:glycyl-tRNA synthetase
VLPRAAADALPASPAGIVAASADKIDSLLGLAAAGCLPSASTDSFGMRRTMYGLLQTLIGNNVSTSMRALVHMAAEVQPIECGEAVESAVLDFAARRLEQYLLDQGALFAFLFSVLGLLGSSMITCTACSSGAKPVAAVSELPTRQKGGLRKFKASMAATPF